MQTWADYTEVSFFQVLSTTSRANKIVAFLIYYIALHKKKTRNKLPCDNHTHLTHTCVLKEKQSQWASRPPDLLPFWNLSQLLPINPSGISRLGELQRWLSHPCKLRETWVPHPQCLLPSTYAQSAYDLVKACKHGHIIRSPSYKTRVLNGSKK